MFFFTWIDLLLLARVLGANAFGLVWYDLRERSINLFFLFFNDDLSFKTSKNLKIDLFLWFIKTVRKDEISFIFPELISLPPH